MEIYFNELFFPRHFDQKQWEAANCKALATKEWEAIHDFEACIKALKAQPFISSTFHKLDLHVL